MFAFPLRADFELDCAMGIFDRRLQVTSPICHVGNQRPSLKSHRVGFIFSPPYSDITQALTQCIRLCFVPSTREDEFFFMEPNLAPWLSHSR